MPGPLSAIRNYGLFGESSHLPDVLHCEPIAARSALHGWELAPHRHARLHQVLLLVSGAGTVHMDGQAHPLAPMTLVNVPPGDVHAFVFRPGTQGWVATLADELLDQLLPAGGEERRTLAQGLAVPADEVVRSLMAHIAAEFDGRDTARALVLRGLCGALLGHVARAIAQQTGRADDLSGSHLLLRRFEALLEQRYGEHWGVADYARALGVSPTHLSRVARQTAGEPALRLIEARVMREARRHLAYTSLPVTTVAYALGYADPAHFSRAFTRVEGVSPRGFRERLGLGRAAKAEAPPTGVARMLSG